MENKTKGKKEAAKTGSAKHTPGPWRYECTNAGDIGSKDKVRIEASDGHIAIVCRVMQSNGRDTFGNKVNVHRNLQEVKANARLIAAAPDLLAELKAWNTWAETLPGGIEQFEIFARKQDNWADAPTPSHTRAAILKAEQGA